MAGEEYHDAAAYGMAMDAKKKAAAKKKVSPRTKELRDIAAKEKKAKKEGGELQGPVDDPLAVDSMPPEGVHATGKKKEKK